jgi:ribose transport system substrate-binding protein
MAVVVAASLSLAACGASSAKNAAAGASNSGSSKSAAGVAYAKAQLAKYTATENVTPTGKPFDARKDRGKTVWYIPVISTVPPLETVAADLKSALSKAGVNMVECNGQGTPTGWSGCIAQAISHHPNAIILDSIAPSDVSAGIAAARKAGIPVMVDDAFDPSQPWYPGASAEVSYDYTLGARLTADEVIAKSDGKADVLVIDTSDLSLHRAVTVNGYEYEFHHYCPACRVTVKAITSSADWATGIEPLVSAALTADPGLDYVVAEYDSEAAFAEPAIRAAGRSRTMQIAAYNADLQQMQGLAAGQMIFADVGSDQNSLGWAEADQALRLMAGAAPDRNEATGTRVFVPANVKGLKLTIAGYYSGGWYGNPSSYESKYLALWGLSA